MLVIKIPPDFPPELVEEFMKKLTKVTDEVLGPEVN